MAALTRKPIFSKSLLSTTTTVLRTNHQPSITGARSYHWNEPPTKEDLEDVGAADRSRRYEKEMMKTQKNPFLLAGSKLPYELKSVSHGMYMRADMPGVASNEIKVWVENNMVFFKGYGSKASEHDNSGRNYGGSVQLNSNKFNFSGLQYEIKNGVLRWFMPFRRIEDRNDVVRIVVED